MVPSVQNAKKIPSNASKPTHPDATCLPKFLYTVQVRIGLYGLVYLWCQSSEYWKWTAFSAFDYGKTARFL